jgi:hypothetical protein
MRWHRLTLERREDGMPERRCGTQSYPEGIGLAYSSLVRPSFFVLVVWTASFFALACGGASRNSEGGAGSGSTAGSGGSSGDDAGSGGTGIPPVDCGATACFIADTCYTNGVSDVPAGDGCNTCSCVEGMAVCTHEPCNTNGDACVVDGSEYPSGSLVRVDCNSCLCIDGELRNCSSRPCPATPARCRGYMDCPTDEICVAPTCGADGVCVERREDCPVTANVVCDCGGFTRLSHCAGQVLGRSVLHAGECQERSCSVSGTTHENGSAWDAGDGCNSCSCRDGVVSCTTRTCVECDAGVDGQCADDEYCRFSGTTCGAGGPGRCEFRPRGNCQFEASGVCGCDGDFYVNYCFAAQAGVSVGECPMGE